MSKPHFREITERRLSEDYDHQGPLDLRSVRAHAHRIASQEQLLKKKTSIHNWDKSEIKQFSHEDHSSTETDFFRQIAIMKLMDPLFSARAFFNANKPKKSLARKYFAYLTSNEIWSMMRVRTSCGHTFEQCLAEAEKCHENIIGFQPLDAQCYTKFKALLWPCIMDFYQIDLHTLPTATRTYGNVFDLNGHSIHFSHPSVKQFFLVTVRNLFNYSFRTSAKNKLDLESVLHKLVQVIIAQYQGQYISAEQFTQTHLQLLSQSNPINRHDNQQPRGLYLSSDESIIISLMGNDHLRILSISNTLNASVAYKKLINFVLIIDKHLALEQQSFAFHPKFGYLTSSIEELGGLSIAVHCTITNDVHRTFLREHFEKFKQHLLISTRQIDPSTMIFTNRPLLGLSDIEKMLRTLYAILIALHNKV